MEDGRSRLSSTTLARLVSVAGHPFLLIPLTIAAATRSLRWAAIVAAGIILPLTLIVFRKTRQGVWSDPDVSRQDQRAGLYYATAPLLLLCAGILYFLGAASSILRGIVAAAVMLAVGLLANRWLKVSLHMTCAAFCTVLLARIHPVSLWATAPFALAIAWSRWRLARHTIPEILFGIALGAAAGFLV